jgi:transcription-repair coupling factor (superfamily II helicase)
MMYPKAKLAVEKIPELLTKYKNSLKLIPQSNPYFEFKLPVNPKGKADTLVVFDSLMKLLEDFKALVQQ